MTGAAGQRKPGCASGTFMALLWPFFEEVVDADEAVEVEPAAEEAPLLPFLRLENEPPLEIEPISPQLQAFTGEMRIPDRDAVAFGSAVHLWLELLHDHPPAQWSEAWLQERRPALRASLVNAGAGAANVDDLCRRLEAVLNRVMTTAQTSDIVEAADKAASWAELAFYSRDGMQLRKHVIDRLYQREDGSFVIVDYKTGQDVDEAREKWRSQLGRYRAIVEAATGADVSALEVMLLGGDEVEVISA
jgi:ATP-dependent exoDNAse (exonuclease V) beta subunit